VESILVGIQTFKKGCIWRVGNGSQIEIWADSWIRSSPDGRIITQRGNIILSKVEYLIFPIMGQRDESLIRKNLSLDANRTLSILLSFSGMEDFMAWRYTKLPLFRSDQHIIERGTTNLGTRRRICRHLSDHH
jgi:hypothetical protein